ncbi:MAG: AAA family ATPase [Aristaeellaceae bacterium]
MAEQLPRWHRELDIFRRIKSCIILEGNILDKYVLPLEDSELYGAPISLVQYLHYNFKACGYKNIVFYDAITGFHNRCENGYIERFAQLVQGEVADGRLRAAFAGNSANAAAYVERAVTQAQEPTVIVMNFASRYIPDPANMRQSEVDGFTMLLQASLAANEAPSDNGPLKNLIILLVNKINDIPAWFYFNNPNVKAIVLPTPTKEERAQLLAGDRFRTFFDVSVYREEIDRFTADDLDKLHRRFVALTEGFTLTELIGLRKLCKTQHTHIKDLCSIVDLYKFGIQENPWSRVELATAGEALAERVKGQPAALTQTLDIVKRAVTGMSDITASAQGKPKGVLFFAGPTGTGKTETAKMLAQIIFGDERACIRFDMSEFSQPHSDQRLLGAPPGYVGYEAGGQLTNAVKNNPFSILLFDEIEKAHPSILDKFLQILEDGRMTDGKGETVYFSEAIIIFTSNLGIYEINRDGFREQKVRADMPYAQVQQAVRQGIARYFKQQLGRPELLNRIGENIVVFDFIREDVAESILRGQLRKIADNLRQSKHIELVVSEEAFAALKTRALANLDNGGRGIGNIVESMFVNPLSRYMFDHGLLQDCRIEVTGIQADAMPYTIVCA